MEIKIVPVMFNIFDGDTEEFDPLGTVRLFPYVLIRLMVRQDCYAENLDGQVVLRRTYQKQFNRVKSRFVSKFSPMYDDNSTSDFSIIEQMTPWLRQQLAKELLVPDKIEIHSIELVGDWPLFTPELTKMAKEMSAQTTAMFFND